MEAVHFGAGNIGRGFIGSLLHQANYHTTFIDVNAEVIQALNENKQYNVILASENSEKHNVQHVSGINSVTDAASVVEAIKNAAILTTAVGPNILPVIAELIAEGLRERVKSNKQPLNIIACENMIGGSSILKEKVYEHLASDEQASCDALIGFPNAAVDRIVPNQVNDDLLEVSVEPYYEWLVEEIGIKGQTPAIEGITYVQDLTPYIERKLFTVNTGHSAVAYIGHYMGCETIADAMDEPQVQEIIKGALSESGEALIQTYHFDREEHQTYINTIMNRFMNPYISDEVTRVGRGPIRKLGPRDRLIRPASAYMEVTGKKPTYLAKTIAAALQFGNEQDAEAVELQQMIQEDGVEKVLQSVSGLAAGSTLIGAVLEEVDRIGEWRR
ncbi:mannitol-1-phosphate 5-dehydrogenase [Virgibacillus natechei]|uniref:Mannitol-1-phosphate 5-dehydrogenase n=1 Tax=Virgibacillus natechei TaxID=1216297 RepID=A0ABS4IEK0_9BACI|nr:mannitol-1-phosphate 5-dehydrogenase [Virgibacillus natechei]MBP1969357.1 mannitol-1-phosphate 5-dehydrogenase [Virgibacillus natechei]UZD12503.1 mannitol-1-phosphate 5-dehydrogenase [Virgibacillus natechei]